MNLRTRISLLACLLPMLGGCATYASIDNTEFKVLLQGLRH